MPKIQDSDETMSSSSRSLGSMLPWILLAAVIIAGAVYAYHQRQQAKEFQQQLMELKKNPQKATEEETKVLLEKVGQLIELPNEQPTVATVTDLGPLKDQPFFAHAQIGDKVLIFSTAKKAVLYRPSTNKVIEIAPVNLDNPPANISTTPKSTTKSANSNLNSNSNSNSNSDLNSNQ